MGYWEDIVVGFMLGCMFWQYKQAIYNRVYDWWAN